MRSGEKAKARIAELLKQRGPRRSGQVLGDCIDWSTITERTWNTFFSNIYITGDGCWNWLAGTRAGYGRFEVRGKEWRAHRWSYCAIRGSIANGMDLDHECENTICVNPWHLTQRTRAQHQKITKERIKQREKS